MCKTFIGPQLRRLRQDQGETQGQMARRLGVGTGDVNLLQNNRRSVSVTILMRLFEVCGIDWRALAEGDGASRLSDLREALLGAAPEEAMLNFFRSQRNHFPSLESAAEAFWQGARPVCRCPWPHPLPDRAGQPFRRRGADAP